MNQQTIPQTHALLTAIGCTREPTGLRLDTEAEMAKHAADAGADIPETPKDAG